MLEWFDFHGHICIVFDKLGHSVYEFLVRNTHRFNVCKYLKTKLSSKVYELSLSISNRKELHTYLS